MERIILIGEKNELEKLKEVIRDKHYDIEVSEDLTQEYCIQEFETIFEEYGISKTRAELKEISDKFINDDNSWSDFIPSMYDFAEKYESKDVDSNKIICSFKAKKNI